MLTVKGSTVPAGDRRATAIVIKTDRKGTVGRASSTPKRLRHFLDGELMADDIPFYATQKPDNKAIKDMLDRAFGKPVDHVDLSVDVREEQPPKVALTIAAQTKGE